MENHYRPGYTVSPLIHNIKEYRIQFGTDLHTAKRAVEEGWLPGMTEHQRNKNEPSFVDAKKYERTVMRYEAIIQVLRGRAEGWTDEKLVDTLMQKFGV